MVRLILLVVVSTICISASSGARLESEIDQEVDLKQPVSFCQGCRSIVSFMSRFNSSTRRQENKELFGRFCETYYPVSTDFRHGPCPSFVEMLFNILNRIDPVNYCDDLGACGTNHLASGVSTQSASVGSPDGIVCDVCTDVIKQVKVQLKDPRFIDDLHKKVDAFCEYLTVIDADKQCRTALGSYIDQALQFMNKIEPREFCGSLHFCPAGPATVARGGRKETLPTLADFTDFGIETSVHVGGQLVKTVDELSRNAGIRSPTCLFCKTFVKEMFKFLKTNRTEENIRDALDRGCDLIYHDKEKRDHCDDLVRAYTKELLELLADETNPEMICILLAQCSFQTMLPAKAINREPVLSSSLRKVSSPPSTEKPITMSEFISMLDPSIEVNSMKTCVECKLFFKYLQETIQEPGSQEEIRDWLLGNLCANLGDQDLAKACTKFVNQESAVFFQAIVETLNPKKSCETLGACTARIRNEYLTQLHQQMAAHRELTPTSGVQVKQQSKVVAPVTAQLCDQCVEIVTKIDDYLSTHPIDHDIAILKDKICNTIQDDNLRGECVMIIQTFGQEIIQAISNMDNPRQLCQKIALCQATQ